MTAAANREILKNDILMQLLGFGTIFLIVMFTYRSAVASLVMMIGLFLANGVVNAYMGYRNIGINLQSLPIVTVGVGFGIDYALYIVSRAVEEYKGDVTEAVRLGLASAGKAVTFTAITLVMATLAVGVLQYPLLLGDGVTAGLVDGHQLLRVMHLRACPAGTDETEVLPACGAGRNYRVGEWTGRQVSRVSPQRSERGEHTVCKSLAILTFGASPCARATAIRGREFLVSSPSHRRELGAYSRRVSGIGA